MTPERPPLRLRPSFGRAFVVAMAVLAAGCVVVPTTRESYDPDCKMLKREMTLEVGKVGSFQRCGGNECAAMLAAAGVVTAATAVVSGSIALVGNVIYWFERQGKCGSTGAETPAS
jgi:hypothetical protein